MSTPVFMQQRWLDTARWLRVIGDTLFAAGAVGLGWFVVGLETDWSVRDEADLPADPFVTRKSA